VSGSNKHVTAMLHFYVHLMSKLNALGLGTATQNMCMRVQRETRTGLYVCK